MAFQSNPFLCTQMMSKGNTNQHLEGNIRRLPMYNDWISKVEYPQDIKDPVGTPGLQMSLPNLTDMPQTLNLLPFKKDTGQVLKSVKELEMERNQRFHQHSTAQQGWSLNEETVTQVRKQPGRQARPKNLRDRTKVIGEVEKTKEIKKSKSSGDAAMSDKSLPGETGQNVVKGRRGRIPKRVINYEGRLLTMREFEDLPNHKKFVVDQVSSPFFDPSIPKYGTLCFHTKWKYYPDNHKEKFNNEWAYNLCNFQGGLEVIEAFFDKNPNEGEEQLNFQRAQVEWNKIKVKIDESVWEKSFKLRGKTSKVNKSAMDLKDDRNNEKLSEKVNDCESDKPLDYSTSSVSQTLEILK